MGYRRRWCSSPAITTGTTGGARSLRSPSGTPNGSRMMRTCSARPGPMAETSNGARLVLFDVDGTLLSAGRAARESILAALAEVLGWEGSSEGNDFSGKTDPQILRELVMESVGRARFDDALDSIFDRYVEELSRRLRPEA